VEVVEVVVVELKTRENCVLVDLLSG